MRFQLLNLAQFLACLVTEKLYVCLLLSLLLEVLAVDDDIRVAKLTRLKGSAQKHLELVYQVEDLLRFDLA